MNAIQKAFIDGFTPDPTYTVSQWADKHRILPKKGSSEPGRYRTSRIPYIKEIMDNLSIYSGVEETCCMKATQLGLTEAGNNFFGYVVDASPGPMLMIFPNDSLAASHSKSKLAPTIEETPRLLNKIGPKKSRDSSNTIDTKEFPGGILHINGANSPSNFRHKTIRFLVLDDVDGYPMNVGDEGDPLSLGKKRTDSYGFRKKIYINSTPTVKGLSRIEKEYEDSDQRQYEVPCPFCKEKQVLKWGGKNADHGIKFVRDNTGEVIEVWYECQFCHEAIDESYKTWMLKKGHWKPKHPKRAKRGYKISSLYSPLGWVSWKQITVEFLEAKDNPEKLKVWTNTRLAETWEERGAQPDWESLKQRGEPYRIGTVPHKGLFLSAGVDVQDNRLSAVVRAWGRDEESFLILWTELFGDPGQPQVWKDLDELLVLPFQHASGVPLYIQSMAVDSGGHHTQEVYNYTRARKIKTIAIKGQSQPAKPIIGRPTRVDVTYMGQVIKGGASVWPVGSDTAKASIYSRLAQKAVGPGFYHFPLGLDEDYFQQLTAEKRITTYRKGFPFQEWVKLRPRNEALDCEVYAYAAALRAGMAIVNWDTLEQSLNKTKAPAKRKKSREKPKPKKAKKW